MCEEVLVRHGAPTLAGLKTGSLFSCPFGGEAAMRECLRCWNRILAPKGLRAMPLRWQGDRALVYLYRPDRLARDLQHPEARALLTPRGYCCEQPARCLARLMGRLREQAEFPHEIGLFLSYPPEDVAGFIRSPRCGFKCIGCWKVYGDVHAARRTFGRYRRCTEIYCARYAEGTGIERLAVAG